MIKVIKIFTFVLCLSFSTALAQVNNQQLNCQAAYNILTGWSRSVDFAANNVSNFQGRIAQQQQFNQLRLAQFDQQRQQIEQNRQAALNYNRGSSGSCAFTSFFFGGSIGNCVPAAVNNGVAIRINYDNQQRNLQIAVENFTRFAQTQLQRMAQTVQSLTDFYNAQKQRCYDAQSKAQSCVWPFTNIQHPQYPSVTCDTQIPPSGF